MIKVVVDVISSSGVHQVGLAVCMISHSHSHYQSIIVLLSVIVLPRLISHVAHHKHIISLVLAT